jgi:chromosomal replication initiation ATPase DnaA
VSDPGDQLAFELGQRPASGIEDFLPAPGNREALAWLQRWPDWPAPVLVLYGPEGSGKSHLARIWAERSGALLLEPGTLATVRPDDPLAWVLDPAEPLGDELGLLRLYNHLKERGGHLLLTAVRPVVAWRIALPDLASRLRAAPAVALGPPDDALLGAVLVKLFSDRQLMVREGVIGYLIRHMERSFGAARAVVARLDAMSLRRRRPITVALARAALDEAQDEQS